MEVPAFLKNVYNEAKTAFVDENKGNFLGKINEYTFCDIKKSPLTVQNTAKNIAKIVGGILGYAVGVPAAVIGGVITGGCKALSGVWNVLKGGGQKLQNIWNRVFTKKPDAKKFEPTRKKSLFETESKFLREQVSKRYQEIYPNADLNNLKDRLEVLRETYKKQVDAPVKAEVWLQGLLEMEETEFLAEIDGHQEVPANA